MQGDNRNQWLDVARDKANNFNSHGKKYNENENLFRFKARAVVCGNQQKFMACIVKDAYSIATLEMFAPAVQSTTFKLLCVVDCLVRRRVRKFDVVAAYLQDEIDSDDRAIFVRQKKDNLTSGVCRLSGASSNPCTARLMQDAYGIAWRRGSSLTCKASSIQRMTSATPSSSTPTAGAQTWCCTSMIDWFVDTGSAIRKG
eukprot:6210223-Pleurochrysis_carterae.AAC.5